MRGGVDLEIAAAALDWRRTAARANWHLVKKG